MIDSDAVLRGAAWLDETYPEGWADRINIDTLDLSSEHRDILAQAVGVSYSEALRALSTFPSLLGIDPDDSIKSWATEHGFNAPTAWDWDELTQAWVEQVQLRTS